MKSILSIIGIFGLAVLFTSAISILETPQDPPKGKKVEKHIKMVTVDDDGTRTELDTVLEGDNVFIWNGDTIGGEHEMKWVSGGDYNINVEESGDRKVIIMKSGTEGEHKVMMFSGDEGDNEMIFGAPHMAGSPHAPKVMMMKMHNQGNVIDLSDPGIISYEKKDLKDGKEKITIIRNKPVEKEMKMHKEIIMHGAGAHPMMIHEGHAGGAKTIKVITTDDGNIEITENGKVIEIKKGAEDGTFISEDGKVIRIKKMKTDGDEKVEVNIEIEEKKKK
ncbi:MAG: hypothetical protein GQ525_01260 [Draconibacterium sp.]|nr:hypothetical protein [Draconibacterium sp.]